MTKEEREEIKKRMQAAYELAIKEAEDKRAKMTLQELEDLKQVARHHSRKVRDEIITGFIIEQRKKLEKYFEVIDYQQKSIQEKFELLDITLNTIKTIVEIEHSSLNPLMIIELFRKIHSLGYEIGHNKATEFLASDFHKPLVEKAVNIIRLYPNPTKDMTLPLKDAMVYEYDKEKKIKLEQEIWKIENQGS